MLTKAQCLNANASEEGDPIFHCYFKTELAAKLLQLTQASISLMIAPTYVVSPTSFINNNNFL
jgi:hypothetical protein